ncbi:hypothetical protein [Bacteroides sedimenti]|uniref:MFS transporter n=1 Tax=Bacteroides sedimenti TaxID=2136147 RepID=A0ABN6Z3T5_9BACE
MFKYKKNIYSCLLYNFICFGNLKLVEAGGHLEHSFVGVIGAGFLFGLGYGMFDSNNMPILCQFVTARHRATAYGIMNMVGVFAGAAVTQLLGKWTDGGNLGIGFAMLAFVVAIALIVQLYFLRPVADNVE